MNIAELMAHLQNLLDHGAPRDAVVRIFDVDTMEWAHIKGYVIDPEKKTLDLYCEKKWEAYLNMLPMEC